MKTTTPSAAIAEIMSRGSVDADGSVRPMRKVELFRKMEAVEPGLPRTKVYDRLKATNPSCASSTRSWRTWGTRSCSSRTSGSGAWATTATASSPTGSKGETCCTGT